MRIQNYNFKKQYGENYNHGMYEIIDENYFCINSDLESLPEKKSILYYDTYIRVDEKTLLEIIDVNDVLFKNSRNMNFNEHKKVLENVTYFMKEKKDYITLLTIKPEKLFERYKKYNYFELSPEHLTTNKIFDEHKTYYYKNIADVEYTTLNQAEETNNFNNNVVNDNYFDVKDIIRDKELYKKQEIFYEKRTIIFEKELENINKKIWTPNNERER